MPGQAWEVELYTDARGRCAASEFIERLPAKDRARVFDKFGMLKVHGKDLGRPHAGYLTDHIWELIVRGQAGAIRLLYFFFKANKIIVTHGIVKKGNVRDGDRMPTAEIAKAAAIRATYLEENE